MILVLRNSNLDHGCISRWTMFWSPNSYNLIISLGFLGIPWDSLGFLGIPWDSLGFLKVSTDNLGPIWQVNSISLEGELLKWPEVGVRVRQATDPRSFGVGETWHFLPPGLVQFRLLGSVFMSLFCPNCVQLCILQLQHIFFWHGFNTTTFFVVVQVRQTVLSSNMYGM